MPQIHTDQHPVKVKQNQTIGQLYAEGHSQRSIAKRLGIDHRTLHSRLHTSQVAQDIIEQIRIKQAQLLPEAYDKHEDLINDTDNRIALDAVKLTYQCTGIIGTRTSNVFNTQVNISQSARDFFADDDTQEAEYEDVIDV